MVSFPESVLQQLEFDQIRFWLSQKCNSKAAKERAKNLQPSTDFNVYKNQLLLLDNYHTACQKQGAFPNTPSQDILSPAEKLKINGVVLELQEMVNFRICLQYLADWDRYYANIQSEKQHLKIERIRVDELAPVLKAIDKILDKHNEVYSNASPRLRKIRERKSELTRLIERAFQGTLSKANAQGYLSETKESHLYGRRVLSVVVEKKRMVKGSILGYSRNNTLAYIEPESTVGLNDENDALLNEERAEIHQIMAGLCQEIAPYHSALSQLSFFIATMDLLYAKYHLALRLGAEKPTLSQKPEIELYKAYHPTLYLKNSELGTKTIHNSFGLSSDKRVMVISGPNAGGKSIALKTIGLHLLMLYSGLFIPAEASSTIGHFTQIFTDIGDNQSIEDELSTYSHKLKNMSEILAQANGQSMVLIDEFGSGSDPELGGAIAEVFLEEVYRKKSFIALTTHYNNIKLKADKLPEAFNASMLFDTDSLQPKYKLVSGVAGQSFTFEVARNAGFPLPLIQRAAKFAGVQKMNFEDSIQQIERERKSLKSLQGRIKQLEDQLSKERFELDLKNKALLKRAQNDSYSDLEEIKFIELGKQTESWLLKFPIDPKKQQSHLPKMLESLKELRRIYLNKDQKIQIRKEKVVKSVEKGELPDQVKANTLESKPIAVGDVVRLLDSNTTGRVLAIEKRRAKVAFGHLESMVKLELLNVVS